MQDYPLWIHVTALMQQGAGAFMAQIAQDPAYAQDLNTYIGRLNALDDI